jgi:hypothetical protein
MKPNIHPNYGEAVVRCACGETFTTGSVKKELKVEICSKFIRYSSRVRPAAGRLPLTLGYSFRGTRLALGIL